MPRRRPRDTREARMRPHRSWRVLPILALTACASSSPEARRSASLPLTAEHARSEAGAHALAWAAEPLLRWVEGEGIGGEGAVATDEGFWRFVYEAPGRPEQLVVTVSPGAAVEALRYREDPPVPGSAPVGLAWIDSDEALKAVSLPVTAAGHAMLLVPTDPPEWRILTRGGETLWRVDARTGTVLR